MPIAKLVVIYQDMYQKPKWYSIRLRLLDSNACVLLNGMFLALNQRLLVLD